MFITRRIQTLAALSAALFLTACGDGSIREKVGLERKLPDEFTVLSRPPLSVPPEFTLRPPEEGSNVLGTTKPISEEAKTIVLGTSPDVPAAAASPTVPASSAEAAILEKAGVAKAAPDIRDTLKSEQPLPEEEQSTLDKLGAPLETPEPLVNPAKEEERIKENKEKGKGVSEGETPTIQPKTPSVLDRIF